MKSLVAVFSICVLLGCGSENGLEYEQTQPSSLVEDGYVGGVFRGRILFGDGSPYAKGKVRAKGDAWEFSGTTNEFGEYSVKVFQEKRFVFSALSPFDGRTFMDYETPIVVNEEDTETAYDCIQGEDLSDCFEAPPITG